MTNTYAKVFLYATLILFFNSSIISNQLAPVKTKVKPTIDGVLEEAVWSQAIAVSGFKTFIPDFSLDMHEKTIVYTLYDDDNLYFAYQCYDSEPEKIKASLTNRDNIRAEDWVCLNLDTFGDNQTLCAFYVNPLGIQLDSRYAAGQEDEGVDFVWYSAGKINSEGYIVEMQIPLESIRYSSNDPVTMSVFFERKISRYSEQGSYPPMDPAKGYAFMTQMMPLIYSDLKGQTVMEILPAVTYTRNYKNQLGSLNKVNDDMELSLTGKYGITSDLILDATYNPDFSQVESDASQVEVNLRSSLFYPEKRSFFLEGRENFNLGALKSSELDPVQYIVHTRTIANPVAGVKMTGNIGSDNTIAALYSVDDLSEIYNRDTSKAHFSVFRYKRSLEGDSYLGAVYAGKDLKGYANRVFGIDGAVRLTKSSMLEFNGFYSIRKFDGLESENGNSFTVKYDYLSRDADATFTINNVAKGFTADMGYISREGIQMATALYRPKIYPETDFIQRIDIEALGSVAKDLYFDKVETFNHISVNTFFGGTYQLKLKYSYSTETYYGNLFDTGGFHVFFGGHISNTLYMGVLYRNRGAILYSADPCQGRSNVVSAQLIYHPTDQIESDLSFVFSDFTRESDSQKLYEVPITRYKLSYQLNKYLFFRGIVEYNNYNKELAADLLASFTYIPGTVIHVGYGSVYNKVAWRESLYMPDNNFSEMKRGLFIKVSYLWRV